MGNTLKKKTEAGAEGRGKGGKGARGGVRKEARGKETETDTGETGGKT